MAAASASARAAKPWLRIHTQAQAATAATVLIPCAASAQDKLSVAFITAMNTVGTRCQGRRGMALYSRLLGICSMNRVQGSKPYAAREASTRAAAVTTIHISARKCFPAIRQSGRSRAMCGL